MPSVKKNNIKQNDNQLDMSCYIIVLIMKEEDLQVTYWASISGISPRNCPLNYQLWSILA